MITAMKCHTLTTSFSGIDAPGTAVSCIKEAITGLIPAQLNGTPLAKIFDLSNAVPHLSAVEWNKGAQQDKLVIPILLAHAAVSIL
jgi:hypothetical protein